VQFCARAPWCQGNHTIVLLINSKYPDTDSFPETTTRTWSRNSPLSVSIDHLMIIMIMMMIIIMVIMVVVRWLTDHRASGKSECV
jgi:hypothetical protein